jgi:hypothetical protein
MTSRRTSAIARIEALLDDTDSPSVGTSMRLPAALRDAAAIAANDLGLARSATELTADALRARLEAAVMQAALDDHYRHHPGSRATLAELAVAAAELDGHPLAEHPDVLRAAAAAIVEHRPDADADDVILWAEATAHSAA